MKVLENLALLLLILAVNAWCVACAYGLLRVVQLLGLERDTTMGRTAAALAALAGVGLGIWSMRLLWLWFRKR